MATESGPPSTGTGKLAAGSIWTKKDQERWYREQMGEQTTEKQIRAAKLARLKCVCDRPLRNVGLNESGRPQMKVLHRIDCPKHKDWMKEYLADGPVI